MSLKWILAAGFLSCALLTGANSCTSRRASQADIATFLDDFETKLEYMHRNLEQCRWEYHTTGRSDSLTFFRDAYSRLLAEPGLETNIKQYLSAVHDNKTHRKLDLLHRRCLRELVNNDPEVRELEAKLSLLADTARPMFEGQRYERGVLFELMQNVNDPSRRQAIYTAAVSTVDEMASGLSLLAQMRNRAASGLGYESYYDLMLQTEGLTLSEIRSLIDDLDRRTAEAYTKALDSLKRSLRQPEIGLWDIGYAFRETMEAADQYFPADNQLSLAAATLDSLGFSLAGSPIYFGAVTGSVEDEIEIMPVHIPDDIRIPIRIEPGMSSMRRLFHQIGQALYAANIDRQDFLLSQPASSCLREGLASVISGLVETNAWYRKYAGMPDPLVMELTARNDFLHLFDLRLALVNLQFERQLYSDPAANLDQVYADLFEKYMLFSLDAGLRPWAAEAGYVTDPVSIQDWIIGQCIQGQLWHYLTEKQGAILDNSQMRKYLYQNLYRSGSREGWQLILERATGEELQARYFMEISAQ